jgi:hypothetical protein
MALLLNETPGLPSYPHIRPLRQLHLGKASILSRESPMVSRHVQTLLVSCLMALMLARYFRHRLSNGLAWTILSGRRRLYYWLSRVSRQQCRLSLGPSVTSSPFLREGDESKGRMASAGLRRNRHPRRQRFLEVVHAPKMMPWGNCAAQFRDPEGTLVGMYTPTTEAAKKRFGGR